MRFKKSPQLPGAGRTRVWHHHGSHTPTSPGAILLSTQTFWPSVYAYGVRISLCMIMEFKVQWAVLATIQVKSGSGSCNEIWILRPFSKAAEKTWSCFSLDTEQQYWTVTVQYFCKKVKKIWMTSNVLPLHFAPSQVSSSQNSNVDNF